MVSSNKKNCFILRKVTPQILLSVLGAEKDAIDVRNKGAIIVYQPLPTAPYIGYRGKK